MVAHKCIRAQMYKKLAQVRLAQVQLAQVFS